MPRIHSLQRYLLIIQKIKNTPYINFTDLTSYLEREMNIRGIYDTGLSRSTIQRDIRDIRTDFSIGITYCRRNQGYYLEDDTESSNIDRFLDSVDMLSSLNSEAGIHSFILPEKHHPMGMQHLHLLIKAIKRNLRISFSYLVYGTEQPFGRILEPYAVKECRGRWYVIGRSKSSGNMRTYGLDRISDLIVLNEAFKKDETVDIAEKFKYSYGIYSSDEYPIEDVVLSFDARDGSYLKSLPLHHSQEIVKDTQDEFIIRLRLRITLDFVMELMSRSWSLKVIEPSSLREQVYNICQSALERNKL